MAVSESSQAPLLPGRPFALADIRDLCTKFPFLARFVKGQERESVPDRCRHVLMAAVAEKTRIRFRATEVLYFARQQLMRPVEGWSYESWHLQGARCGRVHFALTAALTIALGVGASTTIFSVTTAVLLRPPPYEDPSRSVIAATDMRARSVRDFPFSNENFFDMRESRRLAEFSRIT